MLTIDKQQFTLVKLPFQTILEQNYNVTLSLDEEKKYWIQQSNSPIIDQIKRLSGRNSEYISELMLIVAKKNPKKEKIH